MRYIVIAAIVFFAGFLWWLKPKPMTQEGLWREVNKWRVSVGKAPYDTDAYLCAFAEQRAKEIQDDWSHGGFRANAGAVSSVGNFSDLGENLVSGEITNTEAISDWLNSPGHRKNLERPYTHACIRCLNLRCVHIFGTHNVSPLVKGP